MSKEKSSEIASITTKGVILGALIGALATVITALLAFPPFQDWVRTWGKPVEPEQELALEKIPFWISTYDGEGDSDPTCCAGRADLEYGNNVSPFPEYLMNYTLSDDSSRYSYVGMVFVFEQSQNFSDYQNIEFTVTFSKEVIQADLKFEDIAQTKELFHLVGSASSVNKFVVPFSNFATVDFKAIRAISFQVDSTFASGSGRLIVEDIRLTK